jgi:phospholipid/cholesterol/gamma-HCH transport system substrate-binding protein
MKSRLEWKVGLFVSIGLALVAGLLIEFSKGGDFFERTYDIRLQSANVSGLKVRAAVLMAGVRVGDVSDISLASDGKSVTLILRIRMRYRIHQDARFIIEQSGFLGDEYVAIEPTANAKPVFKNGGEAQAEVPFSIQEVARTATGVLEGLDETATNLNTTLGEVHRFLLNKDTLTNLATAAGNLRLVSERALATLDDLDALMTSNAPALAESVSNVVLFSRQMDDVAAALGGVVATNGPGIAATVKNIESSSAVLKNLLEDMRAGKGPAGTLLEDDQLSASMRQIANNLSITTSNLNRLGLWSFLWHHEARRHPEAPTQSPKARSE